jgi:uncharacterized protein (TIGR04141 family)
MDSARHPAITGYRALATDSPESRSLTRDLMVRIRSDRRYASTVHITPPEDCAAVAARAGVSYRITGHGTAQALPELTVDAVRTGIHLRGDDAFDALRVHLVDRTGALLGEWPLVRYLGAELTRNNQRFVLVDGVWYGEGRAG